MAYTTEIYFLVLLEDGSLRLVCQHGWVLVRALFLACRWLLSHCIHTCDSNGAISSPSSYKATILVHSLNFNYLLKTLSHAVTLGVRASTYTRKTWEHNSVHSNIKGDSRAHRAPSVLPLGTPACRSGISLSPQTLSSCSLDNRLSFLSCVNIYSFYNFCLLLGLLFWAWVLMSTLGLCGS